MIDDQLLKRLYPELSRSRKMSIELQMPLQSYFPVVTQQDAQRGYIMRYFVRPVNEKNYIIETDQNNYDEYKTNARFITAAIKWKIVGPKETVKSNYGAMALGVKDANLQAVSRADLTFGGLTSYIRNYTEYWIAEA
jgi:hypothetical protein